MDAFDHERFTKFMETNILLRLDLDFRVNDSTRSQPSCVGDHDVSLASCLPGSTWHRHDHCLPPIFCNTFDVFTITRAANACHLWKFNLLRRLVWDFNLLNWKSLGKSRGRVWHIKLNIHFYSVFFSTCNLLLWNDK